METKNPPQKGFVKYFGIVNLYIVLVLNAGLAELRPSQAGTPEINRFVPPAQAAVLQTRLCFPHF